MIDFPTPENSDDISQTYTTRKHYLPAPALTVVKQSLGALRNPTNKNYMKGKLLCQTL